MRCVSMRWLLFVLGLVLAAGGALSAGCASTSISSYRDPAYEGRAFRRAAVYVVGADLSTRQNYEQTLAEELSRRGVDAFASIDSGSHTINGVDDVTRLLEKLELTIPTREDLSA